MTTMLDRILETKRAEVAARKASTPFSELDAAARAQSLPRGFRIAALLDSDAERIGTTVNQLRVHDIADLEQVLAEQSIAIAIIATPAAAAQKICDRVVAAGVSSILNFAPTVLAVPRHVDLRQVDLAAELQILSFHESRKAAALLPGSVPADEVTA